MLGGGVYWIFVETNFSTFPVFAFILFLSIVLCVFLFLDKILICSY